MEKPEIERHPLQPFLPANARLLMLASFPPLKRRWAMDFFYPNFSNQMWSIFGLVFFGDADRLINKDTHTFKQSDIQALLNERGVAIYDTACAVRRLSGNASDKDLEIVEKTDIPLLLLHIPHCHDIVCTGQKSFSVLTEDYGVPIPAMGAYNDFTIYISSVPLLSRGCAQRAEGYTEKRSLRLWRMPSSSRAYPMKLEEKAAYYRKMMKQIGLL